MIKSMTGYGRCSETVENMEITAEIKAVNHRYFEFSSKVPRQFGFLDEKIKQWTIRTLLTHSTGYTKMMYSAKEISEQCINTNDLVFEILKTNIDNKPNQKFVYNNAEPYLLSVFFYENFGVNISDFIAERIFKPLNIGNYRWDNYGKY